jgi:EamA domain-containing membrane protein RarD
MSFILRTINSCYGIDEAMGYFLFPVFPVVATYVEINAFG